jgi:hypothetical protein
VAADHPTIRREKVSTTKAAEPELGVVGAADHLVDVPEPHLD